MIGRAENDRLVSADGQCSLIQVSLGTPFLALQTRTTVDRVEVSWPNGLEESWDHVAADQFVKLKEGSGTALRKATP